MLNVIKKEKCLINTKKGFNNLSKVKFNNLSIYKIKLRYFTNII